MSEVTRRNDDWQASSYLSGNNAAFVEDLYEQYLRDPESVAAGWRTYFESLQPRVGVRDIDHAQVRARFEQLAREAGGARRVAQYNCGDSEVERRQVAVLQLINAYRFRGHQRAMLDPLGLTEPPDLAELDLVHHGLADVAPDTVFNTGSLVGPDTASLQDILRGLRDTYCGHIGAEYMHIADTRQKRWIQQRMEGTRSKPELAAEARLALLRRLTAAEGLEKYLHAKYVGQKRFSLEGGEALIPLVDETIQRAGAGTVREIVIGMAHRGRLNMLVNVMGKQPRGLFSEFEGQHPGKPLGTSGDVKYHQGFSSDIMTEGGSVHIALAFNPSHLEIIDPVVEGSVRARQDRRRDRERRQVLPVLIHGDAAYAGQGVVMETLNLSGTRGYATGGTVHIVVNNQIGFTTSDPLDSRSTIYCTDVAKMVQAPIFHVNGDDPEAVVHVARLALDYRIEFGRDVVIDLVCYRRHGHSEADEPYATQPVMYKTIAEHPTLRQTYAGRLAADGVIRPGDEDDMVSAYRDALEAGEVVAPHTVTGATPAFTANWKEYGVVNGPLNVDTSVTPEAIQELGEHLITVPPDFTLHAQVQRVIEARREMLAGTRPLDWGFAETLAYATLLKDGFAVRLSGQDSARGTFFHRHSVLHNQTDGRRYVPLRRLYPGQPEFLPINSLLSEEAVLAFEVGYATAEPETLVIWEAQFGDFANNAQVVIDQFISSSEAKWQRYCGVTLLLPHGYEGQGPEHSSARLERYLQLCAEQNIQVCVPTTPAQMFHLLRRQMLRKLRKPLVVMSPKSLLRHKASVSALEELCAGTFKAVIDEVDDIPAEQVRRIVVCAGKVYYDLLDARRRRALTDTVILRIEQFYPFPDDPYCQALRRYENADIIVWCQEEPQNQGAWYQSQHHLRWCLMPGQRLVYAGRPPSASPAAGSLRRHLEEQGALVDQALGAN